MSIHDSHVTRFSFDFSSYDVICVNCGATDEVCGGLGPLAQECPKPVGQGGVTEDEYWRVAGQKTPSV